MTREGLCHTLILPDLIHSFIISLLFSSRTTSSIFDVFPLIFSLFYCSFQNSVDCFPFLFLSFLLLNYRSITTIIPGVNFLTCQGVGVPLLVRFRTFCWSEIMEELQNTYKLKELTSIPVSVLNNV